jgi:hypothetical protein
MLFLSLDLAFTHGLSEDRPWVHAFRPSAGRMYLYVSRKIQSRKSQGKVVWKTTLPASSDLAEIKEKDRKRKNRKPSF